MTVVLWKAELLDTRDIVAVKIVPFEVEEDLLSALAEVNLLKNCKHANVVSYIGSYVKRSQNPRDNFIWVASNLLIDFNGILWKRFCRSVL